MKIPLGLWEGSTENATLAPALLSDLVDRGLDPEQAILFVIDGGKASAGRSRTCSANTRSCIGVIGTIPTSGLSRLGLLNPWVVDASGRRGRDNQSASRKARSVSGGL